MDLTELVIELSQKQAASNPRQVQIIALNREGKEVVLRLEKIDLSESGIVQIHARALGL